MALENCIQCGNLFNKQKHNVCPKCIEKEAALLSETQQFLRKNKNASILDILDSLEVEKRMLDQWIKDKLIRVRDKSSERELTICITCGRSVKKGIKICKTCQLKKLSTPSKQPGIQQKKNQGMYVRKTK